MPALRNRSRKSGTSTPYASTPNNLSPSDEDKKDKAQSSLDAWIEPPLKNPTASFEEHGFARFGVLENMAPLGVPPSQRMKAKARAIAEPATRRSTSGRNGNLLVPEEAVMSTPEMTPAPEGLRDDSDGQDGDDVSAEPAAPEVDEDEDDDWVPKKSKAKSQVAKTPVRGKTPIQNKTPSQTKTPIKNMNGVRSVSGAASGSVARSVSLGQDAGSAGAAEQMLQIAVNHAIARARDVKTHAIEYALQLLHEESLKDRTVRDMLEGIIYQTASSAQFAAFRRFIKDAKKRYKRNLNTRGTREARTMNDADRATTTHSRPLSPSSSPGPAKATNGPSPGKSFERSPITKTVSGLPSQFSDPMDISRDEPTAVSGSVQPHPLSTVPALAKRSPSPTTRMPSKSPRKNENLNGSAAHELNASTDANMKDVSPADAATPDSILGPNSDSDLSDVNEEIVQNGPPVSPKKTNGSSGLPAPAPKKTHPAATRIGKKSRANSAKPSGRSEKKAPPTAEELAEEEELRRKREQMAALQATRAPYDPPVSDTRFEDEMLETESLTSSQIAVGPPTDEHRPRRTGRAPRLNLTQGKRLREDSISLSSPQVPPSATSTRPATPVFAQPPAKRLKLTNGGAARTKRSPVKNRDGPIAGIAHAGGGSRQLGPDDNDPASPPSESDDFCSACKCAGEFVCCDTCPRVYHFLCCDPPRLEPPLGSFFCQECSAKVPAADAPSVESFAVFGPLMKKLNTLNPRSFALPADIQDYFEGVSARGDGSYGEEVKKISLARSSGYGYQKPDYLRTHDSNNKLILCCSCGKSTGGKRPMLKCDYCPKYWHLDCCDPPLANPPPINADTGTRDAWRCPQHIENDFRSGELTQNDLRRYSGRDVDMADASARHSLPRKIRKPKHPSVVEPTFSHGMRNNGIIDIINDLDDETDGEGNYVFPTLDDPRDPNYQLYRIPEKGIVLDFINKVKSSRIKQEKEERKVLKAAAKAAKARSSFQQQLNARPIAQQQAALHLVQLANKEKDVGLQEQNVNALILGLKAEAPQEVISDIADQEATVMTDAVRAELLKLRELIDRALAK